MMDTELAGEIKAIRHTLVLRWWIFGLIALIVLVGSIGAFYNLMAVQRIEVITLAADLRSRTNEASIEAAIKQQIIYQQQLAQYMDFLSRKNPKVKVPRVVVRPPIVLPSPSPSPSPSVTPDIINPLTEADLTRDSVSPAPGRPSTARQRKPKPKPTATPFRWPWTRSK
jgi:hypothetical protein